ncbi:hypothetical protein [Peijinzhouia sedimentorum]
MMKLKSLLIVMFLTIPLSGCIDGSTILIDEYRIYPQDEFGDGHYLICKLGCDGDPKIQNIASVGWNDRFIIVGKKGAQKSWYVIKAKGEKLKCCNGDVLTGPLSEQELKEYIEREAVGELKEKSFE